MVTFKPLNTISNYIKQYLHVISPHRFTRNVLIFNALIIIDLRISNKEHLEMEKAHQSIKILCNVNKESKNNKIYG